MTLKIKIIHINEILVINNLKFQVGKDDFGELIFYNMKRNHRWTVYLKDLR